MSPAAVAHVALRAAGWGSRYASLPPSPSGPFGHGPQRLHGLLVAGSGEGDQRGGGKRGFLDRGRGILPEVGRQPADGDPRVATRILPRDQRRQLERFFKAQLRQLPRGGQRGYHVAAV